MSRQRCCPGGGSGCLSLVGGDRRVQRRITTTGRRRPRRRLRPRRGRWWQRRRSFAALALRTGTLARTRSYASITTPAVVGARKSTASEAVVLPMAAVLGLRAGAMRSAAAGAASGWSGSGAPRTYGVAATTAAEMTAATATATMATVAMGWRLELLEGVGKAAMAVVHLVVLPPRVPLSSWSATTSLGSRAPPGPWRRCPRRRRRRRRRLLQRCQEQRPAHCWRPRSRVHRKQCTFSRPPPREAPIRHTLASRRP